MVLSPMWFWSGSFWNRRNSKWKQIKRTQILWKRVWSSKCRWVFHKIRENNVIVDVEERRALVKDLVAKCAGDGEQVHIEDELLDEVANLIEYPCPIVGSFNSDFLEVPQEVLIISMQVHQRYFPILDSNGKLLPKFVVVRNGVETSDFVRKGNEKFYQLDLLMQDSSIKRT